MTRQSPRSSPVTHYTTNFNNGNQSWSQQPQSSHHDHLAVLGGGWLIDWFHLDFRRHNRHVHSNSIRWNHNNSTRYIHKVINQKCVYGNATKNNSIAIHRNENVIAAMKVLSPAALEVISLTTFNASSGGNLNKTKTLSLRRMSDMETWSHRSPHVNGRHCGCVCDHLGCSQWSQDCHSTKISESAIFALSFVTNTAIDFNYINQSSDIWYVGKQSMYYTS